MSDNENLLSRDFLILNGLYFLNICNVTVFFHLRSYLQDLNISPHLSGLLIGLFALSALCIRFLLGFVVNSGNDRAWMLLGAGLSGVALFGYNWGTDFWHMAAVRILHGAGFGMIDAAAMTRLVGVIPPKRSGVAFQILFVSEFLPFGLVPPLLKPLISYTGSFLCVTDLLGVFMLLLFPLILIMKTPTAKAERGERDGIDFSLILKQLRNRGVWIMLGANLMLYTTLAIVFFTLEGHGDNIGVANPGWFFLLKVLSSIAVRFAVMPFVDRMSKTLLLAASLGLTAIGYVMLAYTVAPFGFFAVGVYIGLVRGLSVPLVAAILFDVSMPRMRAFTAVMNREMTQAGYFIGPTAAGIILLDWGYGTLYLICATLSVAVLALIPFVRGNREAARNA